MDPFTGLTPEQINTILSFSEITQIDDTNLCRSILSQNNWNLDISVENFINNRNGDSRSTGYHEDGGHMEHTPLTRGADTSAVNNGDGGLFDMITSPLRWLFRTTPVSLSPELDTSQFVDKFHMEYGSSGDDLHMERTSYAQAVRKAHNESKFLLVYLHSPLHDDTNRFCSQVLTSDGVIQLVNGTCTTEERDDNSDSDRTRASDIIAWGGQVWDPEGYNLSIDLGAASFPFVALLMCQSDRSVTVLDRIHGFIDSQNLTQRIQNTMNAARAEIDRVRNEQLARTADANLRVEQDREYLEAMERDREMQMRAQREREAKEQAEQEEAQRKELEEAMALSAKLSRESALEKNRAALNRETPSGGDSATIRFHLPQGTKISQAFWKDDTVEILYDFLSVHFADNDIDIVNFVVSTNFPKKDLTEKSLTIADVGLHPRGALFVHNLDS